MKVAAPYYPKNELEAMADALLGIGPREAREKFPVYSEREMNAKQFLQIPSSHCLQQLADHLDRPDSSGSRRKRTRRDMTTQRSDDV